MKRERILIFIVLVIFLTGMMMGPLAATHTFKDDGYKYKMSTKKVKKMKKYAKKHVRDSKHVKVSKVQYYDSIEPLKVGKTYTMMSGEKFKVLKLVKEYKGSYYGGGGYKYKIKMYGHMNCVVEYSHGKYHYYATAY